MESTSWIWLAIAAALFQTLRFSIQKVLSTGPLSAAGATFSRFAYAAPFAALIAGGYVGLRGTWPDFGGAFWVYVLCGGLTQILATWCVIALFARRNFAVGITFKKTEVMQTALFGLLILGDLISLAGFLAILVGLIGVLVLSDVSGAQGGWLRRMMNPSAGLGLLGGALFAVSAVTYRGATLEVASDDAVLRAVVSVAAVTMSQTLGMALWMRWRAPAELGRVWAARRIAVWTGLTSVAGSVCWFIAFTQQNAAYVFAVGQVEVIFSIVVSVLFFREVISRREILGISLVTASVLLLVLLG